MKEKGRFQKIIKIAAIAAAAFCVLAVASFGIADAVAYSYKMVQEESWDYTFWFTPGGKDEPSSGSEKTVEVVEKFDEEKARSVVPGTNFQKVIDLKSNASYESYGYILLEIETVSAMKAEDSVPKIYDCAQPQINTDRWELIWQEVSEEAGTSSRYIYRYKDKLQAKESTQTENNRNSLCTLVKIPEFTEVTGDDREISAKAYLIQTTGFEAGTAQKPGTADEEAIKILTE